MKRYRWTLLEPETDVCERLSGEINVSMPIARALCNRGITGFDEAKSFFSPDPAGIPSPFLFRDMPAAVERVQNAVEKGEHIMLYGDYDVDGTTGTALLLFYFRSVGADVSYYINDRFSEGYGLSESGVEQAIDRKAGLVITVDCGIRAVDEISALRRAGIDVIVCDHHEAGELPPATAILDPKVPGCGYPFRELCGCGVALKLVQALSLHEGGNGDDWHAYLDLVAIATIADMVSLKHENRLYMHLGLERLRTTPRMSIEEITVLMGSSPELLTPGLLSFGIAPRINAAGRLHTASTAVEWLVAENRDECRKHAGELERLNTERREIDSGIFKRAEEMVEGYFASYCSSLVLYNEEWHLGVLGIVASRLQEKYYLPTVVMGGNDGLIKGSVRSVGGLNIYEVLEECGEFIEQFGGHEAAAGLTLRPEQLQGFRKRFDAVCAERLSYEQRQKELLIDTELSLDTLSANFMKVLARFAPFGLGNPEPVFLSRKLSVSGYPRLLKNKHVKFAVKTDAGAIFDVIGFSRRDVYQALERGSRKPVALVYTLEENEWNGRKTVQLKMKDIAFEE
ncbi:single-stranded-DNA-specific exonuclease RecJ [Prosthecochloris sp. HL-130-GSB]|uniref:Single-stranded-DNA-specific exonuclease RecJ n=2 Tax=Prosthecochloris TaxID=1101 RepID=A0A831WUY2_PROAE|nr:single-stranded-DNA-specific exonuclease RecJ [Prosthecochloris sp. HL-130-GSB]ARM31873.1 single-stranded-DNA-specific exonuclease RecJ [Prosthecochloris sp. HL-130-GSB]MBO8093423.1 single-stranded-DNA-specific exonuclease RecJ [Prosthecochloris sp.]HED30684.1 single-stranded-DNA-specific exonuclease RecJ [Prosthecochloris aestuarii]